MKVIENVLQLFLIFWSIKNSTIRAFEENQCSNKEECDKSNFKYDQESNEIFQKITEAVNSFEPCTFQNCSCYDKVIQNDLEIFQKQEITSIDLNSVADRGTKYQIVNHKLYRQKTCMFPSRCAGIEHFIKLILEELPNMEMIINCRDWPQIHKNFLSTKPVPVFSFSKTKDYFDIMYPAWSFWEGGPAISLYPTGIGRWDKHRDRISKAAEKTPWPYKLSRAFFRGSRTSDERDSLILLSRKHPELVDAQYTKNQAWKSPKDTLNAEPSLEISFEEHCKYKFLFNFRGVAASFRFKHLFLCKSLVFHVGNDWQEFFYESLKPWVHYIPLKSYPSEDELKKIIVFFQNNDSVARNIAESGFNYIWEHLTMSNIKCYWKKLLLDYSKIINYKVEPDKNLIEIN